MLNDRTDGAVEIEILVNRRHQRRDAVRQFAENAELVLRQILLVQAVFRNDQILQKRAVKEEKLSVADLRTPFLVVKVEREKTYLRVKRPALGIGIVFIDIGVVLRTLLMKRGARAEICCEPLQKRRLSCAYGTADRNVLHIRPPPSLEQNVLRQLTLILQHPAGGSKMQNC